MGARIRRYFIAGLLVWLPIAATYIVIRFIIGLLNNSVKLLPHKYQPDTLLGMHIPGIGLAITIIVLFLTGLLATNYIGHRIIRVWEKIVDRIPLIRSIYAAVKQVLHAVLQPNGQSFRKVLLVEFPRKGIWSIAFQTSTQFHSPEVNEDMVTAFIPTTPNPTSGFLTFIPKQDVTELDMSVEEGLRMVISLGVVVPKQAIKANATCNNS
ncbi:MAG: DUF502 domain-containing protein [Gammaproteobacteria bacterium]|nr:DUF502 domain-containing protein [Gammaproteobacteria bacterium]